VDAAEALTYSGRHYLVMSETGELAGRERAFLARLERSGRALSVARVAGGFADFQQRSDPPPPPPSPPPRRRLCARARI
jgi:hypothetical protein